MSGRVQTYLLLAGMILLATLPGYLGSAATARFAIDMMVKLAEAVGAEAWDMIRPCDEESAKNPPK